MANPTRYTPEVMALLSRLDRARRYRDAALRRASHAPTEAVRVAWREQWRRANEELERARKAAQAYLETWTEEGEPRA